MSDTSGGTTPIGGSLQDLVTSIKSGVVYLGKLVQIWTAVLPRATGSFTMTATATHAVAEPRVQANSIVQLIPTNAAAGTLQGSAKSLYIVSVTAGVGFTVATANAANAAGTETFQYSAINPVV
jgi:Mrp family chromosome partitioning ATPase